MLDPVGAEERFGRRYDNRVVTGCGSTMTASTTPGSRSTTRWPSGSEPLLDAALRPRRGGPRFVTDDERAAADELAR